MSSHPFQELKANTKARIAIRRKIRIGHYHLLDRLNISAKLGQHTLYKAFPTLSNC